MFFIIPLFIISLLIPSSTEAINANSTIHPVVSASSISRVYSTSRKINYHNTSQVVPLMNSCLLFNQYFPNTTGPFYYCHPNLIWPVTFANPENRLSDTFGARIKDSNGNRYDFHRGIDIQGATSDKAVAAAAGEVDGIWHEGDANSSYPDGGNVVRLKHDLPTSFYFHNELVSEYYTLYMHLSSINVAEGNIINQGDTLGYIGHSGDTDFDHLHFEIRVGSACSYENSLAGGCGGTHMYDPHINPLTFLNYPELNSITVIDSRNNNDLNISLTLPRNELDFNRLSVKTYDAKNNFLMEKIVDYNQRESIDATSESALDTDTYNGVQITPADYSSTASNWSTSFTFQNIFTSNTAAYEYTIIDAHNHIIYTITK